MTARPTAIIVDDEPQLRQYLIGLLGQMWPDLEIVAQAGNGADALSTIEQLRPEIAFLDIQMPGINGLEVAQGIHATCQIVFITAFDQYAVEAFEHAAIDYLLKPVKESRLRRTIKRLQSRQDNQQPDMTDLLRKLTKIEEKNQQYLQWIKAPGKEEIHLLPVSEVDYLQSRDKYTSVFSNGREYLIRIALSTLESQLDPEKFWRVHRSTIVRIAAIGKISKDLRGHHYILLK